MDPPLRPTLLRFAVLLGLAFPAAAAWAEDWIPPANEPVAGPTVTFSRSNAGWMAVVSLPGAARAIAWRLGEAGPWQDTGLLDAIDPRTQRRMPNPSFPLDAAAGPGTLYVRYLDAEGAGQGPFPVSFDPAAALVRDQRRTLDMLQGNWVSFRVFNGVLLYYTTLVSYRCAIQEFRIGLDLPKPDRAIPLPPCDPADPVSIPSKTTPYMRVPEGTQSVSVQLTFRDGTASPVRTFSR